MLSLVSCRPSLHQDISGVGLLPAAVHSNSSSLAAITNSWGPPSLFSDIEIGATVKLNILAVTLYQNILAVALYQNIPAVTLYLNS